MKSLTNLPAPLWYISKDGHVHLSHITIPQPVGPDLPIITHDVTTASKMLGVHFSPAGNSSIHVKHMLQKELDWVDALNTKPCLAELLFSTFPRNVLGSCHYLHATKKS
jgi:hypothetical protein